MTIIQRQRIGLGWSRRTLAAKALVTEQTIKNLEKNLNKQGKKPKVQERIRAGIAKALGVDQGLLFKSDGKIR